MPRILFLLVAYALTVSAQGQTSRGSKYVAVISILGEAKNSREYNTWNANILTRKGSLQYQLSKEIAYDTQYPSIYLADNGFSIVVNVFSGVIEFYDNTGSLIKSLDPFGRRTAEHEQIIKCSLALDRAAFLLSNPETVNAKIFVSSLRGDELWQASLRGNQAAELFLSSDGNYLAGGSYTMLGKLQSFTQVFNKNGNQVAMFDETFRFADISDEGRIAMSTRNSVQLRQIGQPTFLFVWKTGSKEEIVTGVRIVDSFIACSVEQVNVENGIPTYNNPSLILLDGQAKLRSSKQLRGSSPKPAMLSAEGRQIILTAAPLKTSITINEPR